MKSHHQMIKLTGTAKVFDLSVLVTNKAKDRAQGQGLRQGLNSQRQGQGQGRNSQGQDQG